ncbi:trypsin-like peptidase domain-containing protein [Ktedonospora formicarum]|uniref:TIR domain-containing protein n=1 Tax=Ktedonospora formicarum TaxID=2778364 RepID=A0A8J3MVA3_9CHLR|nr:trypsin-like peptidase domain-containing protein [Ktedonospora formicarum]GHO50082.1 hypothetical protein KSX_82450 [Ktedonospora formicarum]
MTDQQTLRAFLRQCVVSLFMGETSLGTGFFVAPGYILTCAHVVRQAYESGRTLLAYSSMGTSLGEARIERYEYSVVHNQLLPHDPQASEIYPDLALLRIALTTHPCVYLDTRAIMEKDELSSCGFNEKRFAGGDEVAFVAEGKSWLDERRYLLKLREGQAQHGLSGAPLLHTRNGTVCGVMQQTRGSQSDVGGRAIPTRAVLEALPELVALQQLAHQEDSRWLNCLDPRQRHELVRATGAFTGQRPVRIVDLCSDNKKDLRLRQDLLTHLSILRRKREMVLWYERDIALGRKTNVELRKQVEEADIILLLLSPDFFASDIIDELVQIAMRRYDPPCVNVVPILMRPVEDWRTQSFGGLQQLPLDRSFLSIGQTEVKLTEVARAIRLLVEQVWQAMTA